MKYLLILIVIMSMSATLIIAGQDEFDDCVLEHLKGTKCDYAIGLIKKACKDNYRLPEFTPDSKKEYNECLLKYLVGVESEAAAREIVRTCKRKY